MNQQSIFWLFLLMIISIFSNTTMAKSPVANTPINQADYESVHTGEVQGNAIRFNAPCNLTRLAKERVVLKDCDTGSAFHCLNIINSTAFTPARLRFYDAQQARSLTRYPLHLVNGDNPAHMPLVLNLQNTHRLEVTYE